MMMITRIWKPFDTFAEELTFMHLIKLNFSYPVRESHSRHIIQNTQLLKSKQSAAKRKHLCD